MLPDAVLRTNDRSVYAAFLRGLFQAGGQVAAGLPRWSTPSLAFSREVQSLLLALGYPTIRTLATERARWHQAPVATVRILNSSYGGRWLDEVGFMSERANRAITADPTSTHHDDIPLPAALVERLAPTNPWLTAVMAAESRKEAGPKTASPSVPHGCHPAVPAQRRPPARPPAGLLLRPGHLGRAGRRRAHLRHLGPRQRHLPGQRLRQPQHHRPDDGL